LYGNLHGEELWRFNEGDPDAWHKEFLRQFATYNVPYFYLASLQKEKLAGRGGRARMRYTDGTVSHAREGKIAKNGVLMKTGDDVFLPLIFREDARIAYSKNGCKRLWRMEPRGYTGAVLSEITAQGLRPAGRVAVKDNALELDIAPGQAFLVELEK